MINRFRSVFLFLFLILSFIYGKSVIAVADVSSEGLSDFEVKQIYNRLESDLVNLGQYNVTSRQEVDKILQEQKFQKSGCTDQQCAAEIGRLLNADYMLLSNILYDKRSGDINVTLKLVDVETARIKTSITKDETVSRPRDINANLADYILELYRKDSEEQTTNLFRPQQKDVGLGTLIIETTPIGATVILDNEQKGVTPLTVENIKAGQHSIILSYTGYERLNKAVMIKADETTSVTELLIKRTGHLEIVSSPTGSDIYINDEYKGKAPLKLQYLDVGDYFLKLSLDGYEDHVGKVTVEWNKTQMANRTLVEKPASVRFYSVPEGATVFVDKKKVGVTSLVGLIRDIPAGRHNISMKLKGYTPESDALTLTPGQKTSLELQLTKLPEGVSEDPNAGWINITGWPEDSQVKIKGKTLKLPIRYYELKKGKYSFSVKKPGYLSQKIPFAITQQKLLEKKFKLKPVDRTIAFKKAWMFPGLGHFYAEQPMRGLKWSALEIAGLAGAFLMTVDFISKNADYNTAHEAYLSATHHDEIASAKTLYTDAYQKRNISIAGLSTSCGIAGAVWIWNVLDINKAIPMVRQLPPNAKFNIGMNNKGQLETQVHF